MIFRHDTSLIFPPSEQVNTDEGRIYQVEDAAYPSVTRVLAARPNEGLEKWKKRVGPKEAYRVAERARLRGTAIHKRVEAYLGNEEELPDLQPHYMEVWGRLKQWLDAHVTCVWAQEQNVFSRLLGVAGRLDLLAEIDGKTLAVVDLKTAGRMKKSEYLQNYRLQCAFYGCAVYELTGTSVSHFFIPVASDEGLQMEPGLVRDYIKPLRTEIEYFYAQTV